MMRLEDDPKLEAAAVREIVLLLRARKDPEWRLMEVWDDDVRKAIDDYAFGEKVPKTSMYRVCRDFLWLVKRESELAEKYLPRREA